MRYPELSAQDLQEFEDSATGKLRVPETAKTRKRTDKRTNTVIEFKRWRESAQVESVEVGTTDTQSGDTHDVYTISFVITGTKGSGKNVNRKAFLRARFNPDAYGAGDVNDGQYKMSKRTLQNLTQLIRSAGFAVQGGLSSAHFAAYFPETGDTPLVGKEVEIEIDQYEDENSPTGFRDDVNNIFPLRVVAASAEV